MAGWLLRVRTKQRSGARAGAQMAELYVAHIPDRVAAWLAVAAKVSKADPMALVEVTGEASEMRLAAEGVRPGRVKLISRST